MLTIGSPNCYQEYVRFNGSEVVVQGHRSEKDEEPAFEWKSSSPLAKKSFQALVPFAARLEDSKAQVEKDWTGTWLKVALDANTTRLITDDQLDRAPDLASALRQFDRNLQFTETSTKEWLKLSQAHAERGEWDKAFAAVETAFRRSAAPYLLRTSKDDSPLKMRALKATFEAGQKEAATRGLQQLVEQSLKRLPERLGDKAPAP